MLADVLELKYDVELAAVEARHEARIRDIARNMKRDGDSIEKIVRNTGLSVKEIEKL